MVFMYDCIIIGGGQAGLVMGYFLQKTKKKFLIIDKEAEIGDVWRKRYDSLTLFTPRMYSSLPGLPMEGEPMGYPTKDEIADYLARYAKTFSLPVQLQTEVIKLSKTCESFEVHTSLGKLYAKNIVVATGPFQKPFIPSFSKNLPPNIFQVHSSEYRNPEQLKMGSVLVVGGGNSGAQIATEISAERKTYLSVSQRLKFLPLSIGKKSIFWYFDKLGLYRAAVHTKIGQYLKKQPDPIFGYELKTQLRSGKLHLKPRTTGFSEDCFIFEDGSRVKVYNVIWATGFRMDFSWINIPQIFDENGDIRHQRGITPVSGLYFLGLPWQYNRGSALLLGVGKDAEYLYQHIVQASSN